jgi:hypothetical protein
MGYTKTPHRHAPNYPDTYQAARPFTRERAGTEFEIIEP